MKRANNLLLPIFLSAASTALALPYSEISDGSFIRATEPFEIGINMHMDRLPNMVTLREMGGSWARIDINWDGVEPSPKQFNFSATDQIVADARSQGLKVYASVAYAPSWARESPLSSGVPDPQAWANFIRELSRHYCGLIDVYGIWNEPNLEDFWTGTAEDYVKVLLKPAYPIIHEESPESLVAGPDLAHLYSARLGIQAFFDEIKRLDGDKYFDILSHHIYGNAEFESRITGYKFAGFIYRQGLSQMLWRAGLEGKEVWITEMGAETEGTDDAAQAQLITRQLALLKAQSWIKKAFIYQLRDESGDGEKWGLMRSDLSLKPVYFDVQSLIHFDLEASN